MEPEDLDVFFADFSTPAVAGGGQFPVIFDLDSTSIDLGYQGHDIVATAKASDASSLSQDSLITIEGKQYRVNEKRPAYLDNQFVKLFLEDIS